MNILLNILAWPFKAVAFIVLLFYEWGWEPLSRSIARLTRFRWMRWMERKVSHAPPWAALLLFLAPTLILLPFKLAAFWLMAHGKKLIGVVVIVLAKIVGTALVAWVFKHTQNTLMQLRWFAWVYTRVIAWKIRWVSWMKATAMWRLLQAWRLRIAATFAPLRQWLQGLRKRG